MAITFTNVPEVAVGDTVTSTHCRTLARSISDRLRSGLGDGTYRIHQYILGAFRLLRASSADGLRFPPIDEFQQLYLCQEPEDPAFGLTDPGLPEGANINNCPAMQWVFGSSSAYDEAGRLTDGMDVDPGSGSPEALWRLGKRQRGTYDPATGAYASPAFTAAQGYYTIVQPQTVFAGKSFGGYQPTPTYLGLCSDGETASWQIKFTNLETDAVVTYPGTCSGTAGHVDWIWSGPFATYVWVSDGAGGSTVTRYDKSTWIEGPYQGVGRPYKPAGDQLSRMFVNGFIGEFRGTDSQRTGDRWDINKIAFTFEDFLRYQYRLAPNHVDGVRRFDFSGAATVADGTEIATGVYRSGFVLGGMLLNCRRLVGSATVTVYDGTTELATLTVTADENGDASRMHWFDGTLTPQALKVRVVGNTTFIDPGALFEVEATEQMAYKPGLHDAYLVLRVTSCLQAPVSVDTRGIDYAGAKAAYDSLRANGCIAPASGALAVATNDDAVQNPVYDAARRLAKDCVRIVHRERLLDYQVVGGKSVVTFNRYANGSRKVDLFDGLTDITGTAPSAGRTNEWLMFMQTMPMVDSSSSNWKADNYADFYPFCQRCHNWSPYLTISNTPDLRRFAQGPPYSSVVIAPELPGSYNYAELLNASASVPFYKSCRVYEKDYEVESVEELNANGDVRVTFKTRFRHCEEAPATIGSSNGWTEDEITAVRAEPYRTDENAIREYLIWVNSPTKTPGRKPGDFAYGSNVLNAEPAMSGSVLPRFFFTKLPAEPYEDDNDTRQETDTLVLARDFQVMELYLRAMCEGFLDGYTTSATPCESTGMFDFTWENVCYQANENRWFRALPASLRADNVAGFGPLPQVRMCADHYNQLARIVNKLDKVRLMLPFKLMARYPAYSGTVAVSADWQDGSDCTDSGKAVFLSVTPSGAPDLTTPAPDWLEELPDGLGRISVASSSVASPDRVPGSECSGGQYNMLSLRNVGYYSLQLSNPDTWHALPPHVTELVGLADGGGFTNATLGFLGHYQKDENLTIAVPVSVSTDAADCDTSTDYFWDGAAGYRFETQNIVLADYCTLFSDGTIDAGAPPQSDMYFGTGGVTGCEAGSEIQSSITVLGSSPVCFIKVPLT